MRFERFAPSRRMRLTTAALALITIAACGAGETSNDTGGTTDDSAVEDARGVVEQYSAFRTDYHEVPPLDGDITSLAGKTVWYVPLGSAVPGFRAFGEGLVEALDSAGVDVQTCDGKFVPTAVSACLDQAGSSGADAVVTGYVDYNLVPTAVDALVDQGIPVLVGGAPLPEGRENSAEISFDDTSAVQKVLMEVAASAVIADSNGTANILFVGMTDSPTVTEVGDHAVEYLEEQCPGCTVSRVKYSTAALDKLPSQVSAALISAPETDYIVTQVDAAVAASTSGAQSAGKDEIRIASSGGDLASLQDIAAGGKQFANAGYGLNYAGWRWADQIVRMMLGGVPAEVSVTDSTVVRLFNADNVGDLTLTPEAFLSNAWFGDDGYRSTFLSAWGIE